MGFLDFIFDKEKAQERQIEKLRKKLTNIWLQSPERNYAAEQLRDMGTDAALLALMERFKHTAKNTTYDNEEKVYVYDLLVSLGPQIIDVVKTFIAREPDQVNWPMRVLDDLLSGDEMAAYIQELLAGMDVDYERDPSRKEQLILRARELKTYTDLQKEVARFTVDDHETIRFVAVSTVADHDEDWAREALRANLRLEDSGRIRAISCEAIAQAEDWPLLEDPEDAEARAEISANLPNTFFISDEGFLRAK